MEGFHGVDHPVFCIGHGRQDGGRIRGRPLWSLADGNRGVGGFVGAVRVRRQKCRRRTVRAIHRQLDDGHYLIYIGPLVSVVARTDVRSCGGRPVSWQFDADAAEPRIYFQCRLSAGGHKLRHRMVAVP